MPLEAEVFLSGAWKSLDELEQSISIPELELIIQAQRDKEDQQRRWEAAVNGVDLGKGEEDYITKRRRELFAEKTGTDEEEVRYAQVFGEALGYELEGAELEEDYDEEQDYVL